MLTLEEIYARCIEDGDCLLWPVQSKPGARRSRPGIGKLQRNPRRVVFELTRGVELDSTMRVLDTCGNRRCCCEHHLVALPLDKAAKAQAERGDFNRRPQSLAQLAKRRGRAKLDMDKARAIRSSPEPSDVLAERYGVSAQTIRMVRSGAIWNEQAANASVFTFRPTTQARRA